MKTGMWVLGLGALMMFACGGPVKNQGALQWKSDSVVRVSDSTLMLHLSYPVITEAGPLADSVAAAVDGSLKALVSSGDSLSGNYTLTQCIDSMLAAKNRDEYMRPMPFTFVSEGTAYRYQNVVSVWLQEYCFTGGAHGMTISSLLNFDNRDGRRLANAQLFTDTTKLSELNRAAFDQYLKGKGITDVASTLFVAPDQLPLPQNIGFDSVGLVMVYNQYEIAPYVFGVSVYTLPYQEVEPLLSDLVKGK